MNERRILAGLTVRQRACRACAAGLLASVFVGLLGACSPWAAARGARDAERSVRAAEQAGADSHASYELTLSKLYLAKAREEAGEAHYAIARTWLKHARKNAQKALALAEKKAGVQP